MAETRGPREKGTLAPGDEITDEATGERFRVLSLIGEGGMGRVFRAERTSDRAPFAVKCNQPIDPHNTELVERMKREGDFLKALRPHPHIVPVFATGMRADGVFWIVMPLLDGASVGRLLSVLRRIPLLWAFEIAAAVCSALSTVHEVGIHRDIKPENVFVTRDGGIYVLDFGAGKSYVVGRMTSTGTAIGTIPYMSPEQLTNAAHLDGRSDLFSVGVLTFEMLTGEHPFDAPGPFRGHTIMIGQRILTEPPRPVAELAPGLPGYVPELIEKLLAKAPEDRSRNAKEAEGVLLAAKAALRSLLGEAPPITRLFDAYDRSIRAEEAARLGTLDTDKAPPLAPSGERPKFGTVPLAAFKPPARAPAPAPGVRHETPRAAPTAPGHAAGRAGAGQTVKLEVATVVAPAEDEHAEVERKLLLIERLSADDTPETRGALLVTLQDVENHPVVRAGAAAALAQVGDETCLEALQECAGNDLETMVRRLAEEAAIQLALRLGFPVGPLPFPRAAEPAVAVVAPVVAPVAAPPVVATPVVAPPVVELRPTYPAESARSDGSPSPWAQLARPVDLPLQTSEPRSPRTMVLAAVLGLLFGVGFVLLVLSLLR